MNAFTDSPDAFEDAFGNMDGTPTDEQRAYSSMEADVRDAIDRYRDDFDLDEQFMPVETDEDDEDEDEDE